MKHRIAIYAEHTTRAGMLAPEPDEPSDDIWIIEGTTFELEERADAYAQRKGAGTAAYLRRCAETIRNAAGTTRPYSLALMLESTGEWEIFAQFRAESDDAANAEAERRTAGTPHAETWYVLNEHGKNINQ